MPTEDEERAWLARIERMFPTIEAWFKRTGEVPPMPAPGSSLARDDQVYGRLPPSHLAYGGIVTAAEHLELFRVGLTASRILYPSSYFTLLRSALMGSTQALWVLKPRLRAERIAHALQLVRDDLRQSMNLLLVDTPAELGLDDDLDTARAGLNRRLVELQAAAAAAGLDPDKVPGWRINMTEMIKTVSELVHADHRGDADTRHGASLLWRLQSGHAHATPSARVRQIRAEQVQQHPDGTLTGAATASFAEVGSASAAAVLFLNEAWRLYELRCTAP
ncbi:hypothetical protein ACIA5G_39430 [Amycolatopsis sp. NPDC051758]|uniref:hypothetical protein n=1 Tax=Amycolatopsis sp. NPDC051758 TaxID=3363935 RepID=UPI00378D3AA8